MKLRILAASLLVLSAAGCVAPPAGPGTVSGCRNCGTVRTVDVINQSPGEASGTGALIGAVIGGVIGHQFGSGHGEDAATAAGAVGGAVAGNELEKQRSAAGSYYRVTIDMDSGHTETVNVANPAGLDRGSRVRVVGRNLEVVQR